MSIATDIYDGAREEARRVLGAAIDYRREHPYVFFLYHSHMATLRRRQGRPVLAWWHRQWRARYWAKTLATTEAKRCAQRHPDEVSEGAV